MRTSGASETENLRAELARGDALAGDIISTPERSRATRERWGWILD